MPCEASVPENASKDPTSIRQGLKGATAGQRVAAGEGNDAKRRGLAPWADARLEEIARHAARFSGEQFLHRSRDFDLGHLLDFDV